MRFGTEAERNRGVACVGVLCALLAPTGARAFSDPSNYDQPAELGGGGGRWFVGTPADGYACDACHRDGEPVPLTVTGLPFDGYLPDAAYDVTISWPADALNMAMIVEIATASGVSAGHLSLPLPERLSLDELCSGDEAGFPASAQHLTTNGRELLSVIDCGARKLRFQWTAPPVGTGTVWLGAGLVASNEDGSPDGDGVTLVSHTLTAGAYSAGAEVVVAEPAACAAVPTARSAGRVWSGWLAVLASAWVQRGARRRRRKGTP